MSEGRATYRVRTRELPALARALGHPAALLAGALAASLAACWALGAALRALEALAAPRGPQLRVQRPPRPRRQQPSRTSAIARLRLAHRALVSSGLGRNTCNTLVQIENPWGFSGINLKRNTLSTKGTPLHSSRNLVSALGNETGRNTM